MEKIEIAGKVVAVVLGGKCLVDDSCFKNLSTVNRGEAVKLFVASGGGIEFTPDFKAFTDYKKIGEDLRIGVDVSDALAFNGITLPPEFRDVVRQYTAVVAPVLATLASLRPAWNFQKRPDKIPQPLAFSEAFITRGSYIIPVEIAKKLWAHWAKAIARFENGKVSRFVPPQNLYESVGQQGNKSIYFYKNRIDIGCQPAQRWELEEAALHYGWTFPS